MKEPRKLTVTFKEEPLTPPLSLSLEEGNLLAARPLRLFGDNLRTKVKGF